MSNSRLSKRRVAAARVMQGKCPICGKNRGEKVYEHLFFVHSYSKDAIRRIQQENRQGKANTANLMQCPQCEFKLKDHRELVEHFDDHHADRPGTYTVESKSFTDYASFKIWKEKLEEESVTRFTTFSKSTGQACTITYFRCSRSLATSAYRASVKSTKKVVRYCTAFMTAAERQGEVRVEFCRQHWGHQQEPALLTMNATSEAYIVSLLKEGFKNDQILKKVRETCKGSAGTQTRLYYTTRRDIWNIATRNKVDPARRVRKLQLNNHCQKGGCNVCPYGLPCECDCKLGVSSAHADLLKRTWYDGNLSSHYGSRLDDGRLTIHIYSHC
ncbi:hypothetical protein RB195_002647 [Necator americanus]|uniref:C2H2-type domain-containing protein n=1 Tax=Necator americanus TaxID=51031 RepID=A0ABR1DKH4_NECAM